MILSKSKRKYWLILLSGIKKMKRKSRKSINKMFRWALFFKKWLRLAMKPKNLTQNSRDKINLLELRIHRLLEYLHQRNQLALWIRTKFFIVLWSPPNSRRRKKIYRGNSLSLSLANNWPNMILKFFQSLRTTNTAKFFVLINWMWRKKQPRRAW